MLKRIMLFAGPLAALAAGLLMRDAGPAVAWAILWSDTAGGLPLRYQ